MTAIDDGCRSPSHFTPASAITAKITRNKGPMLGQWWASVVDGGPTFPQHWAMGISPASGKENPT